MGNLVQYWREQKHQLAGAFVAAESGGFKAEAALTRLEDKVKGLAEVCVCMCVGQVGGVWGGVGGGGGGSELGGGGQSETK